MRERDEASGPRRLARALGRRLSYANVTATVALFVALAGGSFAVAALSGQEKRVVKKIAKTQANKRITARAPDLSVKRAKSADSATNADQASSADSATNATNAENATLLGGLGSTAFQRRGKGVNLTNSSAPSVAGINVIGLIPPTPMAIATLSDGVEGQMVTLVAGNSNVSATDSFSFDLAGNWTGVTQGDTLTVIFFEGGWQEVSRSNN
jgi:hypothetical protein